MQNKIKIWYILVGLLLLFPVLFTTYSGYVYVFGKPELFTTKANQSVDYKGDVYMLQCVTPLAMQYIPKEELSKCIEP